MSGTMTSIERVLAALSHKEADRVPMFLLTTMHGAKELGLSIREYFSRPENVVEGQLRLRRRFRSDCFYTFHHAALEAAAWGIKPIFYDDGPPNAGEPCIARPEDIERIDLPRISECKGLQRVLECTRRLKDLSKGEVPLLGVVMSPFSFPVIQMGFDRYLDLIHERPDLLERLLRLNETFCVEWANAQLDAGATAICYFDPVSSPTIIESALYRRYGLPLSKRTITQFKGPAAIHFASGRELPIVDDVKGSGALAMSASNLEDLSEMKAACAGKIAVVGNLNALEMRKWNEKETEEKVREAIRKAAPGGGFILSDNHGEIPYQVPDDVLLAVADAVEKWGQYPIRADV